MVSVAGVVVDTALEGDVPLGLVSEPSDVEELVSEGAVEVCGLAVGLGPVRTSSELHARARGYSTQQALSGSVGLPTARQPHLERRQPSPRLHRAAPSCGPPCWGPDATFITKCGSSPRRCCCSTQAPP